MRPGATGSVRDLLFPELVFVVWHNHWFIYPCSCQIKHGSNYMLIYLNWSSWFVQPVRLFNIKFYFYLISQHDKPPQILDCVVSEGGISKLLKSFFNYLLVGKAFYRGRPKFLSYCENFQFWRFLYIGINILFAILW
jgi:hypothetical protein